MPATSRKELFVTVAYNESHEILPHRAQILTLGRGASEILADKLPKKNFLNVTDGFHLPLKYY